MNDENAGALNLTYNPAKYLFLLGRGVSYENDDLVKRGGMMRGGAACMDLKTMSEQCSSEGPKAG
jgi:hypothetical protein